jgi:hypothetical protein
VGNVARAMIKVQAPDQQTTLVKANADTGGSKNLASSHLLQNVRKAEDYGGKPIYMVTIQGDSPAYTHQGELHFSDEKGNPIILLCYVQEKPIPGHEDFVLISNNTLVDMNADINFHARASKEVGVLPLRRTVDEPFHYLGTMTRMGRPRKARQQRSLRRSTRTPRAGTVRHPRTAADANQSHFQT